MVPNLVRKRGFLYIRSQIPKKIKRRERRRKVDQKRVCTEVRQKKKKKKDKNSVDKRKDSREISD